MNSTLDRTLYRMAQHGGLQALAEQFKNDCTMTSKAREQVKSCTCELPEAEGGFCLNCEAELPEYIEPEFNYELL